MQLQSIPAQSESAPVRIVIAAVQPSFRQMLRGRLESEPKVQVIGDSSDARAAHALTRRLKPDILLIESALNREYAEHCLAARDNSPSAHGIVAIIETPAIQDILEAFELGARGVVMRASLPLIWTTGFQSILAGQYWVEDKSVVLLLEAVRDVVVRTQVKSLPEFGLTMREIEIAGKIAAGRSNKDVGREFSICERTVKHHLTSIFKKVGVSSRLELAVLVRDKIAPHSPPASRIQPQKQSQRNKSAERSKLYLVTEP